MTRYTCPIRPCEATFHADTKCRLHVTHAQKKLPWHILRVNLRSWWPVSGRQVYIRLIVWWVVVWAMQEQLGFTVETWNPRVMQIQQLVAWHQDQIRNHTHTDRDTQTHMRTCARTRICWKWWHISAPACHPQSSWHWGWGWRPPAGGPPWGASLSPITQTKVCCVFQHSTVSIRWLSSESVHGKGVWYQLTAHDMGCVNCLEHVQQPRIVYATVYYLFSLSACYLGLWSPAMCTRCGWS